jgi:hypothetical protein
MFMHRIRTWCIMQIAIGPVRVMMDIRACTYNPRVHLCASSATKVHRWVLLYSVADHYMRIQKVIWHELLPEDARQRLANYSSHLPVLELIFKWNCNGSLSKSNNLYLIRSQHTHAHAKQKWEPKIKSWNLNQKQAPTHKYTTSVLAWKA